jgi:hypothetical protein
VPIKPRAIVFFVRTRALVLLDDVFGERILRALVHVVIHVAHGGEASLHM